MTKFELERKTNAMARQLQQDINQVKFQLRRERINRGLNLPNLETEMKVVLNGSAITSKIDESGIVRNGKQLQYNKAYKLNGVTFKLWNPAKLSKKQWNAIHKFSHSVHGDLPGIALHKELAPWIDLIFKFNRNEITESQFRNITKIDLQLSTWDYRSDHNL